MSKIRNLLNKLKQKNKKSDDLDEVFFDQQLEEDDSALHYSDDEALDEDNATKEISLDELPPLEDESDLDFDDIDEVVEQEAAASAKKELDQEDEFDYTFNNKTFTEGEIDIDEGKLTFKDKLDLLSTRFMDRFRNLNKKDLNQAMKPPREGAGDTKVSLEVEKLKSKVSEVQWNKLIDRILNPQKNQKVHHFFQISVALLIIFIIAELMGIFIQGKPNYANSGKGSAINIDTSKMLQSSDLDTVRTANLFKTSQTVAKKTPISKPKSQEICVKADSKSSLPIKLHHTIVLQDSVKSIASVSIRSNKIDHIREGQKIKDMAKVDRINRTELLVRNLENGNCESIPSTAMKEDRRRNPIQIMPKNQARAYKKSLKEVKGIKNDGNDFTVERSVLKEKLQDMSTLLTQARAIQINNPDGTISFKIVEVQPDGIFASLGVGDGDIINSINGEPIQNLNQIMTLFGTIANLNSLKLGMSRGGEEVQQSYTIK